MSTIRGNDGAQPRGAGTRGDRRADLDAKRHQRDEPPGIRVDDVVASRGMRRSVLAAMSARLECLPGRYWSRFDRRRSSYSEGAVVHTMVVPVGGDHFTNDIAVGLPTALSEAEKIKMQFGCAVVTRIPEPERGGSQPSCRRPVHRS